MNTKQNEIRELDLIRKHIRPVKAAGYGDVRIQIANGIIVHISHSIGEQVKKGK